MGKLLEDKGKGCLLSHAVNILIIKRKTIQEISLTLPKLKNVRQQKHRRMKNFLLFRKPSKIVSRKRKIDKIRKEGLIHLDPLSHYIDSIFTSLSHSEHAAISFEKIRSLVMEGTIFRASS